MTASPTINIFDRPSSPPHLVSLVLQSKKGLQHGEQLCSHAHELTHESARQAVDVLALDAKIRWITEGVLDQLKAAVGVAKSITERRVRLEEEAKQWDRARTQHQDALDATLESLGSQVVPPTFHQSSLESSLFGIQLFENKNEMKDPTDNQDPQDRSKWKTLRDFVDERALEDLFESIEEERNALDETLAITATYPATIISLTEQIRTLLSNSLPGLPLKRSSPFRVVSPAVERRSPQDRPPAQEISGLLIRQERASATMASHLESLAVHYDQMATALRDKEAGGDIGEEDMDVFVRDTAELPSIIAELEESISSLESTFLEIKNLKNTLESAIATQRRILDSLDSLGDKMEVMLQEQSGIETETQATYETLNDYLDSLHTLRSTYETYQMSYNALVLEMDRRRHQRDAMEVAVQEMRERLESLHNEEMMARDTFYAAHASSIPDDLCLAISNIPQTYVISLGGEGGGGKEVLPTIEEDLLVEARRRLQFTSVQVVEPVRPGLRREDSL